MAQAFTHKAGYLFLLALLGAGCAPSPEARRDKYLSRGKVLLAQKAYSRAILEFKNAAQAMPRDAEPYYQIGVAAAAAGDLQAAVPAFKRAVDLNPKHADAEVRLSQLMVATNDHELLKGAQGRLEALLRDGSTNIDALNSLALTELKLGDVDGATQNLHRALAQFPGELNSSFLLARMKLTQNDPKGAEAVLKEACAVSPKSPDASTLLGEFYVGQKRMVEAEMQFRHSLDINPKNGPALMNLARLQLTVGRKQEAEQSFKQLAALKDYQSLYAVFLFQEGRTEESIRELEKIVKENPDDRQMRTNLMAAYHAVNRPAEAIRVLDAALKKNPKDGEALLQRAELAVLSGKYADAERDLNEVRRLRPNSPELHYVLARLNQARGTALTYRQELFEALRLDPALLPVRVELARELLNKNEARAALEAVNGAPAAQRSSLPLIVERNWALWALGESAEMRKGIDEGLKYGQTSDLLVQDGVWKLRSGNTSGGRAAIQDALKLNPADVRALRALYESYANQKDPATGLKKVMEYASRQPQSADVQNLLGSLLMVNGERMRARSAFQAAKTADPKLTQADLALAQLDVLEGKLDDARNRLRTLLDVNKDDTIIRMWLADVDAVQGNQKTSIENLRQVVDSEQNSRNAQALNNLAYLLAENGGRLDEALKYAERAVQLAPDNPAYCDTLGWILYHKGVYGAAVKYLERADGKATAGTGDVTWKYHLAMAYAKNGDSAKSRSTLDAALRSNSNVGVANEAKQLINVRR